MPGDRVSYTIKVTNKGTGGATSVSVVDNLNANLLYLGSAVTPSSAPAVGVSGKVQWSIPSLAANGGSVELPLETTVAANAPAGTIGNTASATVDGVLEDSNTVTVTVNRTPNVSLRKTINGPNQPA